MGDITAAVRHYIDNVIRLSQDDISASAKSREWFLNRVITTIARRADDGTSEPVLYKPTTVYFGSYFKGTKVSVVDEYDVILVVDTFGGTLSENGVVLAHGYGVADPNPLFLKKYYKSDDSGVSPDKLLNWLKGVVEEVVESFGGTAPVRNGQAVTARIETQNIDIDLVPAVTLRRDVDSKDFYAIPRGDAAGGWISTSPEDDKRHLVEVASGKKDFRNVVRVLKRIRDCYNFKVPSFSIETDVINYAESESTYWTESVGLEVRYALVHLAGAFRSGSILDPFNSGKNLIEGIASLDWYAKRIDAIVEVLDQCKEISDQERVKDLVYKAFEND